MKTKNLQKKYKPEIKEINIWDKLKEGWKVDKAKFKYILKQVKDAQKLMDNLATDSRVNKIWESKDIRNCRYNYNIETEGGTIYIGIESNQTQGNIEENRKTLVLEYNPQKTDPFEIDYLRSLKEIELHRRKVMYLDLAYDMNINIKDIEYRKRRNNEYECKISHEELETIYLRKMGNNGAVRIYNKTLEMNGGSNEDIEDTGEVKTIKYIGECTRYEIRIKPEELGTQFNIPNPFLFEELTKLHNIDIKRPCNNDEILNKLINDYTGATFKNLLTVHIGAEKKLDKNTKNKYIELYEEIKKSASTTTEDTQIQILKNFNHIDAYTCVFNYLKDTTIYKDNQILISEI